MLTDLMPWINLKYRSGVESLLTRAGGRLRRNDGGSLVEFAMVLPMMMVVVTGIFSFGIALNNYLELTNAVTLGGSATFYSDDSQSGTSSNCPAGKSVSSLSAIFNQILSNLSAARMVPNSVFPSS